MPPLGAWTFVEGRPVPPSGMPKCFVGVMSNELGSQGGLDTLTRSGANIVGAWHVQC